ncbi:hypothetical protein ACHAXS_003714 [Conticribra weissflogii]
MVQQKMMRDDDSLCGSKLLMPAENCSTNLSDDKKEGKWDLIILIRFQSELQSKHHHIIQRQKSNYSYPNMMFPIVKSFASRSLSAVHLVSERQLSTSCSECVDKLHNILENYRATNYSREMPKRFRSDIAKVACTKSSHLMSASAPSRLVSADGIEGVLKNIGAGHSMPRSEIELILRELGDVDPNEEENYVISVEQMLDIISGNNKSV